jgi:hypothetical protein
MQKDRLYRLMDIIEEIKEIEVLLSQHEALDSESPSLIMDQYRVKKEQLLIFFIEEINASSVVQNRRLGIIKQLMEKFYKDSDSGISPSSEDEELYVLEKAISA